MSTVLQSHLSRHSKYQSTCVYTHTHTQTRLFSCEIQCPRERSQRKVYLTEPFPLFLKKELMIIRSLFCFKTAEPLGKKKDQQNKITDQK